MSQVYKSLVSGPVPPTVATSYTTDDGTAVPAANILDVRGIDNSTAFVATHNNIANGVIVIGGAVQTNAGNRIQVQLTNRYHASATTTDATPQTLFNLPLGTTPGTYLFNLQLAQYDSTHDQGGALSLSYAVRTNGVTATKIGSGASLDVEDETLLNESFTTITLPANALDIAITGSAATTINWTMVITYVFAHT